MTLPSNKKMSVMCILEILKEHSDENHPLTQADIIKKVYSTYGMELERKSVATTIDSLIDFSVDIVKSKQGCYLAARQIEPSEIAFLIDAIFASQSIDSKNSKALANKLSAFLSKHQRKKFNYIYKSDDIIRTNNKQLFYTIDVLHEAIENNKQVEFNYNRFYLDKQKQESKKERRYIINPYFMVNKNGKYYLVCNNNYFNDIANYKLDLITDIKILDSEIKPIKKLNGCEKGVDIANYINENIYMFNNSTINAKFKVTEDYAFEYFVEWFGRNCRFEVKGEDKYAYVKANETALIYWCLQYGECVELLEPIETRETIKQKLKSIYNKYKG